MHGLACLCGRALTGWQSKDQWPEQRGSAEASCASPGCHGIVLWPSCCESRGAPISSGTGENRARSPLCGTGSYSRREGSACSQPRCGTCRAMPPSLGRGRRPALTAAADPADGAKAKPASPDDRIIDRHGSLASSVSGCRHPCEIEGLVLYAGRQPLPPSGPSPEQHQSYSFWLQWRQPCQHGRSGARPAHLGRERRFCYLGRLSL
mmetsp:Transcript_8419/g.17855  ORF Transcript_8419/g.17855 Transcript_8419/m.17855 type:complete len:207 (+) Transcript_8419:423-1043(+)